MRYHPGAMRPALLRAAAALALVPGLAGCPPPPFPEDHLPVYEERPVEASFATDFEAVWEETLGVFSDLYPLDRVEKDRGVLTTEWVVGNSDYIFNVFSGTRIPEKIRFKMMIDVGERNGRTVVRVRSHEQVEKDIISANLEFTGAIYEWIDVPSSCRKERNALERIAERLDRAAGRKVDMDLRR